LGAAEGDAAIDEWARVMLEAAADAANEDPVRLAAAHESGLRFRRDQILGPALDRVLATAQGSS
jgi:hypothetical protein